MSATQVVGPRLHPGLIASVIIVCAAAIAAAVLIIRKYCFPVNEATYRYSLLRRQEDHRTSLTEEDDTRGPYAVGEESDEELLRWILKRIGAESTEDYTWTVCFCFKICICQITFPSPLSLHFFYSKIVIHDIRVLRNKSEYLLSSCFSLARMCMTGF